MITRCAFVNLHAIGKQHYKLEFIQYADYENDMVVYIKLRKQARQIGTVCNPGFWEQKPTVI